MGYDNRFPYRVCPTCGTDAFDTLAEHPPAVRCKQCRLGIELAVSDHPTAQYQTAEYDARRNAGAGGNRWSRYHHDCAVAVMRYAQIREFLEPLEQREARVWVDVGAGNGAVLVNARRRGWRVVPVEADADAVAGLNEIFGFAGVTYRQWLSGAVNPVATVVSFYDVLEHLIDPTEPVRRAGETLTAGGLLVVEVPDLDAAGDLAQWKHRRIAATRRGDDKEWDATVEHQYHFCEGSLALMVTTFAPALRLVYTGRPVEGRLTMVWCKAPVAAADPVTSGAEFDVAAARAAMILIQMPADQRDAHLAECKQTNQIFHTAVVAKMALLRAAVQKGT